MKRQFAIGVLLGLSLAACAGATFPYKYYGIDLVGQKLHGPTVNDDLDLTVCDATSIDKSPCTAMMSDAFRALKQDYMDTQNALVACQHQLGEK